jgi:hypothetical protein
MFNKVYNWLLTYSEILQFSVILFILAILGSTFISSIFTEIDKRIEKDLDPTTGNYKAAIMFSTLFQLSVISMYYYIIARFLEKRIVSVSYVINSTYKKYKTIDYTLHIVLIILLIELNPSIKHNLHKISDLTNIDSYNYKY